MADVEFVRLDLSAILPDYQIINDCLNGQRAVKARTTEYLPMPDAGDLSPENILRYGAYLRRAVFYNVTQRTRDGLVGEVFLRPPVVEVPDDLDPVVKDANGDGVSLEQQAKITLGGVLAKGRCGLLVDYPTTTNPTTKQQQIDGYVRPTITFYEPENIINWRIVKRGGKTILSLVVLREIYDREADDGMTSKPAIRYRVLQLVNNVYTQTVYNKDELQSIGTVIPIRDGKGRPLTEIPFTFVGSRDNSQRISPAPMLSLAEINVAHYRNSADYEESVYQVGQPTPVATGLTAQWIKDVLHGELRMGARGGIPLPEGATFNVVQVQPNSMAKEAMDAKEKQMVAIGAKLVDKSDVEQTATEAVIHNASETSVLQSCAGNVEAAFRWALEWCGIFTGLINFSDDAAARGAVVKYELNTDFDIMRMSWQDRQQLLKEWQANGITTGEYRAVMRQAGVASLDDAEFEAQQEVEIMQGLEREAAVLDMQNQAAADAAPATGDVPPKTGAKPKPKKNPNPTGAN